MAKYCKCERFYDTEEFKENAIVRFKELPIKLLKELGNIIDEKFMITSVLFRVDQNGVLSTIVELDKLPGKYFDPNILVAISTKDLESKINTNKDKKDLNKLIRRINELESENSYLRNLLNHSLNNNF